MKFNPLKKQVIVTRLDPPKTNNFVPADSVRYGDLCRVVACGPECDSGCKPGDVIIVLGGQIYTMPEINLSWVHDGAILFTVEDYEGKK